MLPSPVTILDVLRFFAVRTRPYWRQAFLLLFGLVIEIVFDAGLKLSSKLLIDEAIQPRSYSLLVLILGLMGAGALLMAGLSLWCDYVWAVVSCRIANDIRRHVYHHLQLLSMGFHSRSQVGDLAARFTGDLRALENGFVLAVPAGIMAAGTILLSAALLFRLEWRLALLTVAGLPLCALGPRLLNRRAVAADYGAKQEDARLQSLVQENLAAQPVVKAFGLIPRVMADFEKQITKLYAAERRSGFLAYVSQRLPNLAIMVLNVIVIGCGALMCFHGVLTVGSLVAFQVLLLGLNNAVASMTWVVPYLITAAGGLQRVRGVSDQEPEIVDTPGARVLPRLARSIDFERVDFRYAGAHRGLEGVSFTLVAGHRIAFVGGSGSGKSTVINLLMRFYDPASGRVAFDGVDLRTVTQASLREQMAAVFQESFLFNLSISENIRLGKPEASEAEIVQAARLAEIHHWIVGLPEGYATLAGERGSRFSGGQRQRLALARALVRNPGILLLDEATSALDPATESAVNETLWSVGRGRTVVVVTHRLASVVEADHIVVMEGGRVVEQGRHPELLARAGVYAQLWQKQQGFALNAAGDQAEVAPARLRAIPMLAELDDALLSRLAREFRSENFPAGRVVVIQGDPSDKFFLIVRGRVEVCVAEGGESVRRLAVLQDGDYFGEMGLLRDEPRSATVRTLAPSLFITLSRSEFAQLLRDAPALLESINRVMQTRAGDTVGLAVSDLAADERLRG